MLYQTSIATPLGTMIAIADTQALHMLRFEDTPTLAAEITQLQKQLCTTLVTGNTPILAQIADELTHYFAGILTKFTTPIHLHGTTFQQTVWTALQSIPYGITCSYTDIAKQIGNSLAVRAVGSANSANRLAIIVPCHRVITADKKIGGYNGGIERKQRLLQIETHIMPKLK